MASRNLFYVLAFGCLLATSLAQQQNYLEEEEEYVPAQPRASAGYSRPRPAPVSSGPKPTPVPILKQINRHNEDGSYTYGYEGADGSFKIETKLTTGEVMGKYGYVDDNGKVRVVEYGANKYGFMPSGEGITVAPPTLVDETTDKDGRKIVQDYDEEEAPRPAPKNRPAPKVVSRPQYHFDEYEEPKYQQAPVQQYAPAPRPQPAFAPAPRPAPRPIQHSRPPVQNFPSFQSSAPVPPRASIPGAAPVFSPAPVYEEPRPAPARLPSHPPQQVYRPQPQRHETRGGRSGILDQLAKDYALPQGQGRPTHDITFGSY